MATANREIERLYSGDHMTRAEFHRVYEQTPPDFHAELIGGIVYVSPRVTIAHGTNCAPLGTVFLMYGSSTPGLESGSKCTILLGDYSEPEPDLLLRILPESGGQSGTSPDDYLCGPPELLGEIAYSSCSIDLHAKKDDYARYGVHEYLVLSLRERRLRWFDLRAGAELAPDPDGVIRVRCFPGLWIHVAALLAHDLPQMLATLHEGLATSDHAEFVRRLKAQRTAL